MSRVMIDRFEEKYAVCEREDKTILNIPRYKLPLEAKEGDCLEMIDGFYKINQEITAEKKKNLRTWMNGLIKK